MREAVDDRSTERVVGVIDPIPLRQHPVDEGPAGSARETLGGDPLRLVDRPREPDAEPGDAERERLQQVVDRRDPDEREAGLRTAEEDEVAEPLHRIGEEPRDQGEPGEDQEGRRHDAGRLVQVLVTAVLPVERHEPEPERVEGREERGEEAEDVQQVEARMVRPRVEGDGEDLPFAEESAEGDDPREGEGSEQHDPRGDRHRLREPAHLPHVVRVDGMDHAPGGQEQEGLEERVVEEMVEGGAVPRGVDRLSVDGLRRHQVRAGAEAQEHVRELGDRREGQDALDVVVHDGHRRGEDRREAADPCDDQDGGEGRLDSRGEGDEEDEGPRGQVNAGLDHRRRVDQGADGRRAFHRVRQPSVERELGRLPDRPAEQEEGDQGQQLWAQEPDPRRDLVEAQRPEFVPDHEDADEEQDVPDAGDEECFLRRRGGLRLVVPESDEQVGAEAHDLPEDQELQEVVRADGPEHPGREEADLRVVARLAFLLVHVAEGIDENQEAEERHEDEHQRTEVVDQERDPDLVSGDAGEPDVAGDRLRREIPANGALSEDLDEDVEREDERAEHRRDGDVATAVPQPSSEEADDDEGGEGQQQDEPGDPGVLDHGSPFQEADFVELDRAVGLVDGEEHREADRRLRRGDRDPEEGEDLAAGISTVRREGDEVEDRGVQDDLDRHEHDDPVPAGEDAVEPDAQQGPGKQELVFQGNQGPTFPGSSIFARYTPPIIAAARRIAIRMIVIAKASNNWFAIPLDDVAFGSYTGTEVGDCGQLTGLRKETAMTPNKAATARTTENSRSFIPAPPAPARP